MRTKHAQYALESIKQSKCQECWWQHCRNHRSRMTFFSNHHINILLFHVYLASHEKSSHVFKTRTLLEVRLRVTLRTYGRNNHPQAIAAKHQPSISQAWGSDRSLTCGRWCLVHDTAALPRASTQLCCVRVNDTYPLKSSRCAILDEPLEFREISTVPTGHAVFRCRPR